VTDQQFHRRVGGIATDHDVLQASETLGEFERKRHMLLAKNDPGRQPQLMSIRGRPGGLGERGSR
jgi:hypothetical protein